MPVSPGVIKDRASSGCHGEGYRDDDMAVIVAERELFRSCQVLFGPHLDISREFLEYLQGPGVKSAYRRRALETHPDLVASRDGIIESHRAGELFRTVHQAYENLSNYLAARDKGFRFSCFKARKNYHSHGFNNADVNNMGRSRTGASAGQAKTYQQSRSNKRFGKDDGWKADSLYQGPLPNRRLLLGHFLYYAGIINWRTVIKALVWQRANRPRLGEIGRRFGWLTDEAIIEIVRNSQGLRRPFGKTAIELGRLTAPQLKLILFQQKCLQKRFGEFFVEQEMLTPDEMVELIARHEEHNAAFRRRPFSRSASAFGG